MLIETEFAERMIQLCRGNRFPREIHSTRGRVSTEKSRRSVTRFVQTAPVILTRDEIPLNENTNENTNTTSNKGNTFNNFPLYFAGILYFCSPRSDIRITSKDDEYRGGGTQEITTDRC